MNENLILIAGTIGWFGYIFGLLFILVNPFVGIFTVGVGVGLLGLLSAYRLIDAKSQ